MGIEIWTMFLLGLTFGLLAAFIYSRCRAISGTLKIDHSNPEKDIYRLEIDDLDKLDKRSRVYLKVDHNADLSQE